MISAPSNVPVGNKEVMVWFNSGSLVTPFIMKNTADTLEVQFPADSVLKTNTNDPYVADLYAPEVKPTTYASALGSSVVSVASFGNSVPIEIKDGSGNPQEVTIRMPTPDLSD